MLYYLSHGKFPSKKAHTIQMVQMCESFAKNGQQTTLVHPSYYNGPVSFPQIKEFYGVEEKFKFQTLPSLKGKNNIPNLPTSGEVTTIFWLMSQTIRGKIDDNDIIYSRYIAPTFAFCHIINNLPEKHQPTIVYEQHQFNSNHPLITSSFYNHLDGIVCIAELLQNHLIDRYKTNPEKIFTAHDGVDVSRYKKITTDLARKNLNLPLDEQIVIYTGHLYSNKGVETLVEAADNIDASVYVVGGYEEDIARIEESVTVSENIKFTGFVEPSKIVYYQCAADVLVATADPDAEYFSPLKLFEYMAAGKPIVATRIPAFEEVLADKENCLYVRPNDSIDISNKINELLVKSQLRESIKQNNLENVKNFTWDHRAERILKFISQI